MQWIRRSPVLLDFARSARVGLLGRLPGAERRPRWEGHVCDWADARAGIPVPAARVFRDIQVVPARRFTYRNILSDGGPVWPDFENTPLVRHMVHDVCVDENATPSRRAGQRLPGPAIWGGRCYFHFGHLAAEHLNRLPASLYLEPRAIALFTLQPGKLVRDVPHYFWAMAAWFGLRPDRIRFVTRPLTVSALQVSPQAEHMSAVGPPEWYLDLLDELARLNRLQPVANEVLYVQRVGQLALGMGAHAGEAALVSALGRAGVAVLDPGRETLERQMALYAGAKLLIFAEGSAIHGRQLLGRVAQKILVLQRRRQGAMARAQLAPRCRELEYAPVIETFVDPVARDGGSMLPHGLAFYDTDRLLSTFLRHGIDLAPHWRSQEYTAAAVQDAAEWRRVIMARHDVDRSRTADAIRTGFQRSGVPELDQAAS